MRRHDSRTKTLGWQLLGWTVGMPGAEPRRSGTGWHAKNALRASPLHAIVRLRRSLVQMVKPFRNSIPNYKRVVICSNVIQTPVILEIFLSTF
jgi:hypothetical protein